MVIVKLAGGLGNQMFQYAAARRIAHVHSTSVCADLSAYSADKLRSYELDCFILDLPVASERQISIARRDSSTFFRRFRSAVFSRISPYKWIIQPEFFCNYYKDVEEATADTYLEGYWQSERYFADIDPVIRHDFGFKDHLSGINKMLAEKISSENSVSIHIRRGDYLNNNHTNEFHGICPIGYYEKAVHYICGKIDQPAFYIFSDDQEWVRDNLKMPGMPVTYVDHNKGKSSFEDMRLMSLCKHNIIANSSFSWWAAWLNANSGKIVIAPSDWFNPQSKWVVKHRIDASDILPEKWIKLKA